jgi:hypothetical protein
MRTILLASTDNQDKESGRFFEKIRQKTFANLGRGTLENPVSPRAKVFCFFFSKKKHFLK